MNRVWHWVGVSGWVGWIVLVAHIVASDIDEIWWKDLEQSALVAGILVIIHAEWTRRRSN